MKVIKDIVPCQEIVEQIKRNEKSWWVWSPLRSENVHTKQMKEGVSLCISHTSQSLL